MVGRPPIEESSRGSASGSRRRGVTPDRFADSSIHEPLVQASAQTGCTLRFGWRQWQEFDGRPRKPARGTLIACRRKTRTFLAETIATRGFVQTVHSSRARSSQVPSDAEARRACHPQIRLVQIFFLACRDYCNPYSNCSSFWLENFATNAAIVKTASSTPLYPVTALKLARG